jgi:hypothetical protein
MKKFIINQSYYIQGKPVIFLGYQDIEHFGFFREAENINTFFGYRLSNVKSRKSNSGIN